MKGYRDYLVEDIDNMEQSLDRLNGSDIWQDKIIKAMCIAIYHLLTLAVRSKLWERR